MNTKQNTSFSVVGGQKLPPPLTDVNTLSSTLNRTSIHALLHQAFASCGRAFLVCLLALPVGLVSCEKDSGEEEGKTPASTTIDTNEVKNGDAQNAASRDDNDSATDVGFSVKVDTAWAGVTHYEF